MNARITISLNDTIIIFLLMLSGLSLCALVAGVFDSRLSVILSVMLTLLFFRFPRILFKPDMSWGKAFPILMLILISLVFRSEPYQYVAGGQDQGVYVNMSQHFSRSGSVELVDDLRQSLPRDLRQIYDSSNLLIENRENVRIEDKREGEFLPGIYVKDSENSEYVFQFYPLHPVWMAIFADIFGQDNHVYSLVFFSILSIVVFYYLVLEISRNKYIAFIAAAFLAVNPLHAFFSKFPVTENFALFFTLSAIYYLLKYYRGSRNGEHNVQFLWLSAFLFGGMFFTRISGFMYLPFLVGVLFLSEIYLDPTRRRHLRCYIAGIFILYAFSVIYGLVFSYPYSIDIYRISFGGVFGSSWQYAILILGLFATACYAGVFLSVRSGHAHFLRRTISPLYKAVPWLYLIFSLLGIYRVYLLGFTESYSGHDTYDQRWGAVGTGFSASVYWAVFVVFEYLSPFMIPVFAYSIYLFSKSDDERKLLLLFLLPFYAYICILQWFIPYQYYYGRYVLSEVLPFALMISLIGFLSQAKYKAQGYMLLILSAFYMLIISGSQIGKKELDGFSQALEEVAGQVGGNDILVLDGRRLQNAGEMKTAMKYYHNINAITIEEHNRVEFFDHFCAEKRNTYFLGDSSPMPYQHLVKNISMSVEIYTRQKLVPLETIIVANTFTLTKLNCDTYLDEMDVNFMTIYQHGESASGVSNIFGDGWTTGHARIVNPSIPAQDFNYLVLETMGHSPLKDDIGQMGLEVYADDQLLLFLYQAENSYYFELANIPEFSTLEVVSATFVPLELGMNQDGRTLGIDIESIKLMEELDR